LEELARAPIPKKKRKEKERSQATMLRVNKKEPVSKTIRHGTDGWEDRVMVI
jgi:hypothetical protein